MITEFIDGLQQFHFLQNALSQPLPLVLSLELSDASLFFEACLSWRCHLARSPSGVALSFILGINFFIGAIVFGL